MINFCLTSSYASGLVSIDEKFFVIKTCSSYEWMRGKPIDVCLHYLVVNQQFIDIEVIE